MPRLQFRIKYNLDKGDPITDAMIEPEIADRFKDLVASFKEEAGTQKEENIYYIMDQAFDPLNTSKHFYIYLIEYFGGAVEDGKVSALPEGWDNIYDRYAELDELFYWAYEQEYGESFTREYDMTENDVKKIKNEVLEKYTHLIGKPIPKEEDKYTVPFNPTSDIPEAFGMSG